MKITLSDFIQKDNSQTYFSSCRKEVTAFEKLCEEAGIPTGRPHRSFRELLESALDVLAQFIPTITIDPKDGTFTINPAGNIGKNSTAKTSKPAKVNLPRYVDNLRIALDEILLKSNLRLWLMVDRLDEIFPRRSDVETRALRGLLRTLKEFSTKRISVKVFLRDDILAQVTDTNQGFTALTHITSRQADKLRWSEEQILLLIVKRLFANQKLREFLRVNPDTLQKDQQYRTDVFYKVFPATMPQDVPTLRWIYEQTMDGQKVVTPRDIIDLLTRAKQKQQDDFRTDSEGECDCIIGPSAIQYGFNELARRKKLG
jgi:hypothetical protein